MWEPKDYIVYGRYCDTESIRVVIASIREQLNAEAAVLFVFEDNIIKRENVDYEEKTFFQSLLIASHFDSKTQERLQRKLTKDQLDKKGLLIPAITTASTLSKFFGNLVNRNPIKHLANTFGEKAKIQVFSKKSSIPEGENSSFVSVSMVLILFNPRKKDPVKKVNHGLLAELWCMVNASAPVLVQKGFSLAKKTDYRLEDAEPEHQFFGAEDVKGNIQEKARDFTVGNYDTVLRRYAESLLKSAMILTGSSVGNFYLAKSDHERLDLIAQINNENPQYVIPTQKKTSVVAHVYKSKRPLLINDIREFKVMHPEVKYLWVGDIEERAYAELAFPIIQRNLGSRSYTVIGVINVEKVEDKDKGSYTYEDLNELKQVALRFCLWQSRTLLSLAGESLALLTRRNMILSERLTANTALVEAELRLPVESIYARNRVTEAVLQAFELTRSRSVTMRLLCPDTSDLIRFCGFPEHVLDHPYPEIPINKFDSINAWVVRNGRECYIPNLNASDRFKNYDGLLGFLEVRKNILSELCIPIFISGRIVGTLNLESEYRDAYSETRFLARAIAEQAGLSLALARRASEQELLTLSAVTTLNYHV